MKIVKKAKETTNGEIKLHSIIKEDTGMKNQTVKYVVLDGSQEYGEIYFLYEVNEYKDYSYLVYDLSSKKINKAEGVEIEDFFRLFKVITNGKYDAMFIRELSKIDPLFSNVSWKGVNSYKDISVHRIVKDGKGGIMHKFEMRKQNESEEIGDSLQGEKGIGYYVELHSENDGFLVRLDGEDCPWFIRNNVLSLDTKNNDSTNAGFDLKRCKIKYSTNRYYLIKYFDGKCSAEIQLKNVQF